MRMRSLKWLLWARSPRKGVHAARHLSKRRRGGGALWSAIEAGPGPSGAPGRPDLQPSLCGFSQAICGRLAIRQKRGKVPTGLCEAEAGHSHPVRKEQASALSLSHILLLQR